MNPAWLIQVLLEHRHANLNHSAARTVLADAIGEAMPRDVIVAAIQESVTAVLRNRGLADHAGDLAREIGRNAAGAVILMLQVGDVGTPAIDLPESER